MLDYQYWLIAAVVLGIIEVTVGANFFLMWCGLSALLVAGLAYVFPIGLKLQIIVFSLVTIAVVLIWQKFKPKFITKQPKTLLNQRANQYLNREFYLEEAIINGFGKVKVDDSSWRVEGPNLPEGTKVKVIGVDGTLLKVQKAEENN
jgi:membrane protein implicated in regulation of membrane protease activity